MINRQRLKSLCVSACTAGWLLLTTTGAAQTNYDDFANWVAHPSKPFNLLGSYNMDIAVIDAELNVDTILTNLNLGNDETGVDIFFVHPTVLSENYTFTGNIPIEEQPVLDITSVVIAQAGLLSRYGGVYAPFYQQATPASFFTPPSDEAQAEALGVAYNDVKAAFIHYLENDNNGNRIILAAHSQGAYLLSMLLRDVLETDEYLRPLLVTAAVGGILSDYADPEGEGGWWEHLRACSFLGECGCVLTWRSFAEEQEIATTNSAHPVYNELLESNGWLYRTATPGEQMYQDSVLYNEVAQPLPYYIIPNGGDDFGTGTGFVAFQDAYSIRYRRDSEQGVGFVLDRLFEPGDQRPDDLEDAENHPLFNFWGYHTKDYHIYTSKLLEHIDLALQCAETSITEKAPPASGVRIYPNPAGQAVTISLPDNTPMPCAFVLSDLGGRQLRSGLLTRPESSISLSGLPSGLYVIKTDTGASAKLVVEP